MTGFKDSITRFLCTDNGSRCLLVHGSSGVGKTYFLQNFASDYGLGCKVKYIDCRSLLQIRRGGIEEYVLGLCSAQNDESIILLDNIDAISGSLGNSNSFIECSVASSVIALIDKVIHSARSRCIATSTCHLRQLHDRLHQPYRFGLSVCLELPDFRGRQVAFLAALRESCCALCVDEAIVPLDRVASVDGPSGAGSCATDIVVALSEIVARRTQGFTFGDVTNIIRDAILSTEGLFSSSLVDVISCQLLHNCIASICDDTSTLEVTAGSATQVLSLSTILHTLSLLSRPVVDVSILGADGGNEAISSANITFLDAFNLPGAAAEMEGAPLVGMEDIQQRLRRVVLGPYFSDTKQYFRRLGIRPCSGVVIQSPPGCGKTALSEWLVHEGREHFKCISVSCAELVDKIVGASEQKLSNIFAAARMYAPCFLLLENIDCILGRSLPDDDGDGGQSGSGSGDLARGSMRSTRSIQRTSHYALDRILSTLLVELDGIETTSSYPATDIDNMLAHGGDSIPGKEDNVADASVVVIATTSDMSLLDGALLRPGRLEEHVHVKSPTATMRKAIILNKLNYLVGRQAMLPNVHIDVEPSCEGISAELAKDSRTKGKSPAQLLQLITEGWISAVRRHIKTIHGSGADGVISQDITLTISSSTFDGL